MVSFLTRPYPYLGNIRRDLFSNFLIGLFVAFFLITFQPFQITNWETDMKTLKLSGFGVISFLVPSLFNVLISLLFKNKSFTENWTIFKEIGTILCVLVFIAFGNMIYGHLLGVMPFNVMTYFLVFGITCTVGLFPVTLHVLLKHNKLLKINLNHSVELNQQLRQRHEEHLKSQAVGSEPAKVPGEQTTRPPLTIFAENNKDCVSLHYHQLLYIESADNYSNIVYSENKQRKKHLLRGSLKRVEGQLNHENIIRCHRAYIVNLLNVKNVEGNAAGYRLYFHDCDDSVPVSRNYVQTVNEKLGRSR